jgi:adenylate cyclase
MAKDRLAGTLAVILHADIADSTALVQQDKQLAHERIQDTFRRFSDTIEKYQGQVLELRGDALLVEFEHAYDAVSAALSFQVDHACYIDRLQDDLRPTVRVGIAMGEVIIADSTVTGAGVVQAQRVEQLADPGGVCVTASIQEALSKTMPLDLENLGEKSLKGFDFPVRVFRVKLRLGASIPPPEEGRPHDAPPKSRRLIVAVVTIVLVVTGGTAYWFKSRGLQVESASVERMKLPLPEKPSIAVLAFDNLSKDPDAVHLSDGIAENTIAVLSKVPELFVIARNSSFVYKGKAVLARQVAEELGVQYVLGGSLQQEGERIRVTAELIDALRGNQLWAETYDRKLEDIFAVQDDLALNIVQALQIKLTTGEGQFLLSSSTLSLAAWEAYTKGLSLWRRYNKEDNYRARMLIEEAIEHDPNWATAYSGLGWTHVMDAAYGWSEDREQSLRIAEKFARKALAIDQTTGNAYGLLARIHSTRGQYEEALSVNERAIEVDPNNPSVLVTLAFTKLFTGNPEEVINLSKRAERLQPITPPAWLNPQTIGYYLIGRYQDAISVAERSYRREPEQRIQARLYAIASYSALGRSENARADVDFVLENDKNFSAREWVETVARRHKDKSFKETLLNRLLEAGLPE